MCRQREGVFIVCFTSTNYQVPLLLWLGLVIYFFMLFIVGYIFSIWITSGII